jgi:hypothetical protein
MSIPAALALLFWRERNNAHYMFENLEYNYRALVEFNHEQARANLRLSTNNDYLHDLLKRHNITLDPWEMYNILPDDLEQWDWA